MNILDRDRRRHRIVDVIGWGVIACGLAGLTTLLLSVVFLTRPCKAADPGFFIGGVVLVAGCPNGTKR